MDDPLPSRAPASRRGGRLVRGLACVAAIALSGLPWAQPAQAVDAFDPMTDGYADLPDDVMDLRPGDHFDYFDYEAGEYRRAVLRSVHRFGRSREVEAFVLDDGEVHVFEIGP